MMPVMLMISTAELTHGADAVDVAQAQANAWRAGHRLIDLHQHVDLSPEHVERAVRIMDRAGIGLAVNLGSGTVTRSK